MDEHGDPQTNAPDEGELLAAYLDAETDDITSARLERLLREDPQVAARLDALARTRARLQRLDDVAPPEGFRERLSSRLAAERAHTAEAVQEPVEQPQAVEQAHDLPAVRRTQRWFAPLATAAALILVAVIGGATLLFQSGSDESAESAGAPAQLQAESAAPNAPMAGEDSGAEQAEEGGGAFEDEAATSADGATPRATDEPLRAATPRVASDAGIAARLQRPAQRTDDPVARESELRARAGLAPVSPCLAGTDATAVDLVEVDGRVVVTALTGEGEAQDVVLFDAQSCERLRSFPAG
jgi:negative regulator of sigma E activity